MVVVGGNSTSGIHLVFSSMFFINALLVLDAGLGGFAHHDAIIENR